MKTIHTTIVQDHLNNRPINKLLNRPPPDIDKKEETLPHSTRRKLSQLRTNKSPLLMTYLHKIDPANHPAANCPLCNDPNHDSLHLFNCPDIPTTLTVWDLWTDPVGVAALLDVWGEKLVLTHRMGSTPPPPPFNRHVFKEVRGYVIRACRLARFDLRKHLLKFTRSEGHFYLLPWSSVCRSCKVLDIHQCFSGVLITFTTADLCVMLNEC